MGQEEPSQRATRTQGPIQLEEARVYLSVGPSDLRKGKICLFFDQSASSSPSSSAGLAGQGRSP